MADWIPSVLAADDEDVGKLIFGAIAALIWGISALVSWANKKQQEAKRRAQEDMMRRAASRPPPVPQQQPMSPAAARQRIAEGIAARYPDVLLPPAQHPARQRPRPVPPPVPQMRPIPQPPKPKRRAKPVKAPTPPPVPQARPQEVLESAVLIDEVPLSRRETHQRTSALAQMLTPRSLRNQFVLLEILQPPLALRDDRH